MSNMATDSTPVARAQINLFNDSMAVWQSVAERAIPGRIDETPTERGDKRFKYADWTNNATFSFIKESYVVAAKSILATVWGVKDLDPEAARKADFYTPQFVDAIRPRIS